MKNNNKKFRTFNDQVNLLKSRGLIITDNYYFIFYLKSYNYQNFINGYNDPFMQNFQRITNKYIDKTTGNAIIDLFNFDRSIGPPILSNIQNIERKFSTALTYIIAEILNHNSIFFGKIMECNDNIFVRIFKCSKSEYIFEKALWGNFINSKNDLYKKYYDANNNEWMHEVPIWSLSIYWSFGDAITIFYRLNKHLQKKVMNLVSEDTFYSCDEFFKIMKMLKSVRNRICHNNVLYNIEIKQDKKYIINFLKRKTKSEFLKIRIYDVLQIIDIILKNNDPYKLQPFMEEKINKKIINSENINNMSKKFILEKMNFNVQKQ